MKTEVKRLEELFEQGHVAAVLQDLKEKRKQAPAHEGLRACIQYIENRSGQFEYAKAKAHGLSIGYRTCLLLGI